MKKILVYDLPTRIFHWLFAFLFLASLIIAEFVSDENPIFIYHMIGGLIIGFLLVLRMVWGFIGTTYARFSSFPLKPFELFQYLKSAITTKTKNYPGHNPASSYAAIIMYVCAIGLAFTGFLMTSGWENNLYEEIHEILATIFLITVIVHIAGVIFHHFKHKDSLWSSMLDGKKKVLPKDSAIRNQKPIAGMLFIILTFLWMGYLSIQYESGTQTLDLFGTELFLGEEDH